MRLLSIRSLFFRSLSPQPPLLTARRHCTTHLLFSPSPSDSRKSHIRSHEQRLFLPPPLPASFLVEFLSSCFVNPSGEGSWLTVAAEDFPLSSLGEHLCAGVCGSM